MLLAMNYPPFRERIARMLKLFGQHRPEGTECRRIVSEEMRRYTEMKRFTSAVREGMSYEELKELSRGFDNVVVFNSDRGEDFHRDGIPARHEVRHARHEVKLDCHGFSVTIGFGDTSEEAAADAIKNLKRWHS
jgi:hypothetical protein